MERFRPAVDDDDALLAVGFACRLLKLVLEPGGAVALAFGAFQFNRVLRSRFLNAFVDFFRVFE